MTIEIYREWVAQKPGRVIPGYDPCRDAEGFVFDVEKAMRPIKFAAKYLTHVKGSLGGKPIVFDPWQEAIIGNLFGWVDENGLRRYRESFWLLGRKNSKTTMVACVGLSALYQDGEPGCEIYCAAKTREQAGIIYDITSQMIAAAPTLQKLSVCHPSNKTIKIERNNGMLRAIASDAGALHGGNSHVVIFDELHNQDDSELYDVLYSSQGSRSQPLFISLTTSDYDRPSVCNVQQNYAEQVRDGLIKNPRFLPVIYKLHNEADWEREECWIQANPALGKGLNIEYLRSQYSKAKAEPSYENTFKRLFLNIKTKQDRVWIQMSEYDACPDELPEDINLSELSCYGGLDLSSTTDLTALIRLWKLPDGQVYFQERYYAPEENSYKRQKTDKVPYLDWAEQGHLILTPGNTIDYEFIKQQILDWNNQQLFAAIGYDPFLSGQVATSLYNEHNVPMLEVRQGTWTLHQPSKEFERLIMSRELIRSNNPITRWCVSNVGIKTDSTDKIRPDKTKSTGRIDGVAALINALAVMQSGAVVGNTPPPVCYLEEEDLIFL